MDPPPDCPLEQKQSAASPPSAWRNGRGIGLVAAGLAALLLVAYWRAIFGGETFVLHDHLIYTLPSRAHLIDALSHGRLPQWWGAISLGAPFAANPNHCALYPPAWLAALFPASVGADVVLLLHMFWLGLGGALLARRFGAGPGGALLAGGALATSGFATSIAVNSLPPITFAWTPWLAWAVCGLTAATDRRSAWRKTAVVATCAAMQILSGEPAGVITSVLLSAFVALLQAPRRTLALARFAGALCFALLLAGFALIPAVELLRQTTRAAGLATAEAGVWSLHPLRLLEFFWPRILGDPGDPVLYAARAVADAGRAQGLDASWALSFYTGAPTLLLAAIAVGRRNPSARALGLASLAFLLIALGTYTPFYQAFRAVVLPERLVRYPQRHFAGTLVLWTTLAGLGFTRLFKSGEPPGNSTRVCWTLAAGFGAVAVGAIGVAGRLGGMLSGLGRSLRPPIDGARIVDGAIEGGVLAAGVLAAIALSLGLRSRGHHRLAAIGVCAAAFAGLVSEVWWLHPMLPRAAIDRRPALLAPIPAGSALRPRLYRSSGVRAAAPSTEASVVALGMHQTVYENIGSRFGVDHFPGWDPARSARLTALWSQVERPETGARILELYGVDYAIVSGAEARGPLRRLASMEAGDVAIASNEARRPRAFVAPRWRVLDTDAAMLGALFASPLDGGEIRIDGPVRGAQPAGQPGSNASSVPCTVQSPVPEKVKLTCAAPFAGYAVLLDASAPGWSATVDGAPISVERADLLVRAVPIPAGTHVVEFAYLTPGLRLGGMLSFPAWAILLAVFIRTRRPRVQ